MSSVLAAPVSLFGDCGGDGDGHAVKRPRYNAPVWSLGYGGSPGDDR